jgi:Transcriptional regulator
MELRTLKHFIAVAEELNFSRAAERLNMAQPPLSQQIKALEAELGVLLLERTKHSVSLTAAGEGFLRLAYKTVEDAETAVLNAQAASRGEIGSLAIGFVASVAFSFLPGLLRDFSAAYPRVELSICDLTTAEQEAAFEERRIDIGFLRPPVEDERLERESVMAEGFVLALPVGHRLASLDVVPLKELSGEGITAISRSLAPGLYAQTEAILARAGIEPVVLQEVGQLDIAVSFAAAGLGLAILPESVSSLRRDDVAYRPIADCEDRAEVVMAWRRGSASETARNFIDLVRASRLGTGDRPA